jgi:putative hydrolase of the HAD superfamily
MLTNVNRSRYFRTNTMLKINNKLFDKKFISCYLHMTKPDRKIYQYVLAKTNLMPNEIIFIDDLIENVNGAREIGINSIVFRGYRDLVSKLERINVL